MFPNNYTPINADLIPGYNLRTPASDKDIHRLASFNKNIHGDLIYGMTSSLIHSHPETRPEHWLFAEETATGDIVSSLCLIPWNIRYGSVPLKAAELGIVGTAEDHRRRGLSSALMQHYRRLVENDGYDLSLIQGIPYFYRQFGYSYAVPLDNHIMLGTEKIPQTDKPALEWFGAEDRDIGLLMSFHKEMTDSLEITSLRSKQEWAYILNSAKGSETESDVLLLRREGDEDYCGYIRIHLHGFSDGLILAECSEFAEEMNLQLLKLLATFCRERNKKSIRCNLPAGHSLSRLALSLGASDEWDYAWQLRFNSVHLFKKIVPVLEKRIVGTEKENFTGKLGICDYRDGIELHWQQGKIIDIRESASDALDGFSLPPDVLTALLFGFRSFEEMDRAYPDCWVSPENREWCRILFPKQKSYFFWPY